MMLFRNEVAAEGIGKAVEAMQKLYTGWKCHNCGDNSTEFSVLLWDKDGDPRCPDCASSEVIVTPN